MNNAHQYTEHQRQQIYAILTKKFRTADDLQQYMDEKMVSAPDRQPYLGLQRDPI